MTKYNPRFEPPELWVLGSVGDYFAEFMAGGIAVICGYEPQDSENSLGYRPCVGMVAGKIFFRGPHAGFSQHDAKLIPVSDNKYISPSFYNRQIHFEVLNDSVTRFKFLYSDGREEFFDRTGI